MVNKSSLAKKLASYSAIAAAVLAVQKNADAQIIYTAVNPPYNANDTTYLLDLNNDGIVDFKLTAFKKMSFFTSQTGHLEGHRDATYVEVQPYNSNMEIDSPFVYGEAINSQKKGWNKSFRLCSFYSISSSAGQGPYSNLPFRSSGPWNFYQLDTLYMPLNLNVSGNSYYGWLRLQVGGGDFTVFGYAYNSVPNATIYAGQECDIQFPLPTIKESADTLTTSASTQIQWYYNNAPIQGDTMQSITVSQIGIYTVTTGDTTICHGTSLPFDYSNCGTLSPPVITTTSNILCAYSYKTLQVDTSTIPKYYSIQWLQNDSIITGETGSTFSISQPANYSVVMSEQGGCTDTSNVLNIVADTLPILEPIITQIGDTLFSNYNQRNLWSTGDTSQLLINPVPFNIYGLVVSDSLGCSQSAVFTYINCNSYHPKLISSTKAYCANPYYQQTTLTIDTIPIGYYQYWYLNDSLVRFGLTEDNYNPYYITNDGTYYAVISEPGGCSDTTNSLTLQDDSLISPTITKQGSDSLVSSYPTGNVWNSYITLTNDSGQVYLPTQSNTYWLVYTDSNGCEAISSEYNFFDCSPYSITLYNNPEPICYGDTAVLNAIYCETYSWFPSTGLNVDTGATVSASPSITTTYYVEGINDYGCILKDSTTVTVNDCYHVWPGDANEDLVVNNSDLLTIGLYYGETGPARDTTTIAWAPHIAPEWDSTQTNGMNMKFVDCNGDGIINSADTMAVSVNYGLTHPYDSPRQSPQNTSGTIPLYFIPDSVKYHPGSKVHTQVLLGNNANPATIYGIAYDIGFDASAIQSGTLSFVYDSSFVGAKNVNAITLTHYNNDVETAVVGTDHVNKTGYGKIGDLYFTLSHTTSDTTLTFSVINYEAIDAYGNVETLLPVSDTIAITDTATGIKSITNTSELISVYPNPTKDQLIFTSNQLPIQQIQIDNVLGQTIYKSPSGDLGVKQAIDVSALPAGMYFYSVTTSNSQVITGKFVKE